MLNAGYATVALRRTCYACGMVKWGERRTSIWSFSRAFFVMLAPLANFLPNSLDASANFTPKVSKPARADRITSPVIKLRWKRLEAYVGSTP